MTNDNQILIEALQKISDAHKFNMAAILPFEVHSICAKAVAQYAAHGDREGVPEVVRTAPARIYLQVSDEEHDRDEPFPEPSMDMTWCADSVLACEVKYIRSDLVVAPLLAAQPATSGLNPLTADLVSRFARALSEKLAAAEQKHGYSDCWAREDWREECQRSLAEHVAKGDPRDVAAYCAFAWHHGWPTAVAQSTDQSPGKEGAREAELRAENERLSGIVDALPADWRVDSSLATWFPYTAQRLAELERALDGVPQDAIDGGWTARGLSEHAKRLEQRIAELEAAGAQGVQWQPIDTAPKDGRALLLGHTNNHGMWRTLRGRWVPIDEILEEWHEPGSCDEGWYEAPVESDTDEFFQTIPTHWMPLPAAPVAENAAEEAK